ncbi:uncharacterized protein TNCV_2236481 [Trichonephila clavipes]|nr:uncharacterized protein TNCV_2236481 [Trichonephila clavipes]
MPSIRGYHPYGLASILTGLESNRGCMGYVWLTNCSPSTSPTYLPELRKAWLDEWCNIPQHQTDNLILSIPSRYKKYVVRFNRQFQKKDSMQHGDKKSRYNNRVANLVQSEEFSKRVVEVANDVHM